MFAGITIWFEKKVSLNWEVGGQECPPSG